MLSLRQYSSEHLSDNQINEVRTSSSRKWNAIGETQSEMTGSL